MARKPATMSPAESIITLLDKLVSAGPVRVAHLRTKARARQPFFGSHTPAEDISETIARLQDYGIITIESAGTNTPHFVRFLVPAAAALTQYDLGIKPAQLIEDDRTMAVMTPLQLAAAGTEQALQKAAFARFTEIAKERPELRADLEWVHAVPNGGERNAIVGNNLKLSGSKKGVWDVFVPASCGKWHGLYVELKTPKHRNEAKKGLSDHQIAFGTYAHSRGYLTKVAHDWTELVDHVIAYLDERLRHEQARGNDA